MGRLFVCVCLFTLGFGKPRIKGFRSGLPAAGSVGGSPRRVPVCGREGRGPLRAGRGAAAAGGQASLGGHANTGEDVGRPGALPAGCPERRGPHLSLPEEVQLLIALCSRLHVHSHPSREARRQP